MVAIFCLNLTSCVELKKNANDSREFNIMVAKYIHDKDRSDASLSLVKVALENKANAPGLLERLNPEIIDKTLDAFGASGAVTGVGGVVITTAIALLMKYLNGRRRAKEDEAWDYRAELEKETAKRLPLENHLAYEAARKEAMEAIALKKATEDSHVKI